MCGAHGEHLIPCPGGIGMQCNLGVEASNAAGLGHQSLESQRPCHLVGKGRILDGRKSCNGSGDCPVAVAGGLALMVMVGDDGLIVFK